MPYRLRERTQNLPSSNEIHFRSVFNRMYVCLDYLGNRNFYWSYLDDKEEFIYHLLLGCRDRRERRLQFVGNYSFRDLEYLGDVILINILINIYKIAKFGPHIKNMY